MACYNVNVSRCSWVKLLIDDINYIVYGTKDVLNLESTVCGTLLLKIKTDGIHV